jgi:bifunctional UDP-N-acetylglucosamine pyrophosphorylase/glucosamine-1-phosphate N-acetyltransferase
MTDRIKAVILAAGEGKRMHPLTETRPKAMLPIANKPVLEHLITEGLKAGIQEYIIVIGYRGEMIQQYFGDGSKCGAKIQYVIQMKQLGTAHAVESVRSFVRQRFLLMNGDILIKSSDLSKMLANDGSAMGIFEYANTEDLGTVVLSHKNKDVVAIHEKSDVPPSNLVNAGIYQLTDSIFDAISRTQKSPRGEYELTDSLQLLINDGCNITGEKLSYWQNLSYPWDILEANESILSEIGPLNLGEVEQNVAIQGPVQIGAGTIIRANSYIVGPVSIGENCRIGPSCYIRAATSISNNCHIGSFVEVKNSIIMAGTSIPHHNYVGDSIIGEGCNLGAGTKIANLRFDEKQIEVGKINSKRHKLGAIIGDGVQTGINASIDSGSLIGNGTWIGPGALASGIITPNSRIF